MNALKIALIWLAALTMNFSSCQQKDSVSPLDEGCFEGEILKSAKDKTGTIHFNSYEEKYAVSVSFTGTYDSQDIGFLCNPPDSLKQEGLSVTFDGDYYTYEKGKVAPVGGATYYYLNILKLKTNKL